jgi:hypothetical protein
VTDKDLQLLSEALSCVPHAATPSLMASSTLCRLFMNESAAASSEFMCLHAMKQPVEVSRENRRKVVSISDVADSLGLIAQ